MQSMWSGTFHGGDGDDILDASGGSAESQSYGDFVQPGLGSNIILGHAGNWNDRNEGIDISYGDVSGVGGMTITSGANGIGTAESGTAATA